MKSLPRHIAVIMDGNGRWAERRLLPRVAGHHRGVDTLRSIVQRCVDLKVFALTLFAFSTENWQRPKAEVKLLMSLLQNLLQNEVQQLHSNNVKLIVIGELERLTPSLQQAITDAQQLTQNNTGLALNIALNYGGRWDIVQAAKQLSMQVEQGTLTTAAITEELFSSKLSLHHLPDPDLLIRTSGEQRISNFLLWQLAYTEFYFTSTLWPEFTTGEFDRALDFFANRQRRFGSITQLHAEEENA